MPIISRRESAVPALAVAEHHGAEDAMYMVQMAHDEDARALEATTPVRSEEAIMFDGPEIGASDHMDPMDVDIAIR